MNMKLIANYIQQKKATRLAIKKEKCFKSIQKALEKYFKNFGDLAISIASLGEEYYLDPRSAIYDVDAGEIVIDDVY